MVDRIIADIVSHLSAIESTLDSSEKNYFVNQYKIVSQEGFSIKVMVNRLVDIAKRHDLIKDKSKHALELYRKDLLDYIFENPQNFFRLMGVLEG